MKRTAKQKVVGCPPCLFCRSSSEEGGPEVCCWCLFALVKCEGSANKKELLTKERKQMKNVCFSSFTAVGVQTWFVCLKKLWKVLANLCFWNNFISGKSKPVIVLLNVSKKLVKQLENDVGWNGCLENLLFTGHDACSTQGNQPGWKVPTTGQKQIKHATAANFLCWLNNFSWLTGENTLAWGKWERTSAEKNKRIVRSKFHQWREMRPWCHWWCASRGLEQIWGLKKDGGTVQWWELLKRQNTEVKWAQQCKGSMVRHLHGNGVDRWVNAVLTLCGEDICACWLEAHENIRGWRKKEQRDVSTSTVLCENVKVAKPARNVSGVQNQCHSWFNRSSLKHKDKKTKAVSLLSFNECMHRTNLRKCD